MLSLAYDPSSPSKDFLRVDLPKLLFIDFAMKFPALNKSLILIFQYFSSDQTENDSIIPQVPA